MGLEETVAGGGLLLASLIAMAACLVSFLSPCVLPLIPGYLAYVSGIADSGEPTIRQAQGAANPATAKRSERRRMVLGSVLFVLGFSVVFLLLNILMGSVGLWLWDWQDLIVRVMGVALILMGLVFMGAFSKFQGTTRLKLKPRIGLVGAPLLLQFEGDHLPAGMDPGVGPACGGDGDGFSLEGGQAFLYFFLDARAHGLPLPSGIGRSHVADPGCVSHQARLRSMVTRRMTTAGTRRRAAVSVPFHARGDMRVLPAPPR